MKPWKYSRPPGATEQLFEGVPESTLFRIYDEAKMLQIGIENVLRYGLGIASLRKTIDDVQKVLKEARESKAMIDA